MVNTQVETLKEGQSRLSNMLQESMVMAEGLYDRVSQGYDELKGEIQGKRSRRAASYREFWES